MEIQEQKLKLDILFPLVRLLISHLKSEVFVSTAFTSDVAYFLLFLLRVKVI